MSGIPCPRCGAVGNESCSTISGRDHKVRWKAEVAAYDTPKEQQDDR